MGVIILHAAVGAVMEVSSGVGEQLREFVCLFAIIYRSCVLVVYSLRIVTPQNMGLFGSSGVVARRPIAESL